MRHPAEKFITALMVSEPELVADQALEQRLRMWSILAPVKVWQEGYFLNLRQSIDALAPRPDIFSPTDRNHLPSVRYLRRLGIYEYFHPDEAMHEAWRILGDPELRMLVEQLILARTIDKTTVKTINEQNGWHLTVGGIKMFQHYFWNSKLLTFDEWGAFLYGRAALYETHMTLLQTNDKILILYLLRIQQQIESKEMIREAQHIAHSTLKQLDRKPGTSPEKVSGVAKLTTTIINCHNALSTSEMALKEVMEEFEHFRMRHPDALPPAIDKLAPAGNYSGSGLEEKTNLHLVRTQTTPEEPAPA